MILALASKNVWLSNGTFERRMMTSHSAHRDLGIELPMSTVKYYGLAGFALCPTWEPGLYIANFEYRDFRLICKIFGGQSPPLSPFR
jgi:hypothetical protein